MSLLTEALQDGNITGEEAEKFLHHFQDPKFRQLFEDYAKEISDPKAKAEQDAYLAQIEAEGRTEAIYGKGTQLIVPEPGLVVKTKAAADNLRVYINICTSKKIDEFTQEQSTDPSRPGVHLRLPTALHGKDAKVSTAPDGGAVRVWDIAVHPAAVSEATKRPSFMQTLATIAIERVEAVSGMKLLRQYKLPKLQYKAVAGHERPSVMSIRGEEGSEVAGGRLQPKTAQLTATAAAAVVGDSDAAGVSGKKQCRSSFSFNSKNKPSGQKQQQVIPSASITGCSAGIDSGAESGVVTPEWDLLERCDTELTQAWQDNRIAAANIGFPKALVLRVQLPGVLSASAVQLHVSSHAVQLEVPEKYLLNVQLKYQVREQGGAAKFDKAKQQLIITLPVLQPSKAAPRDEMQQDVSACGLDHGPDACVDVHQQIAHDKGLQQQLEQQHEQHAVKSSPTAAGDAIIGNDSASSSSSTQRDSTMLASSSNLKQCVPAAEELGQDTADALAQRKESQPKGPTSSSSGADVKAAGSAELTTNQVLWEQLHRHHDSTHQVLDQHQTPQHNRDCSRELMKEQQTSRQVYEQGSGQNTLSDLKQKAENCRAILKPRMQSRRVTSSALD